jgi:LTXXQ motif family protein
MQSPSGTITSITGGLSAGSSDSDRVLCHHCGMRRIRVLPSAESEVDRAPAIDCVFLRTTKTAVSAPVSATSVRPGFAALREFRVAPLTVSMRRLRDLVFTGSRHISKARPPQRRPAMHCRLTKGVMPLGAFALASMLAIGPAAQSRAAPAAAPATVLGPAMLRPGTAELSCGTGPAGLSAWGVDRIEQALSLTGDQIAKFNALKAASAKAFRYLRESCPTNEPISPTGRVEAMEHRLEAMLEAVREVKPALDDFYGSLTDEQKAHLNAIEPASNARAQANTGEGVRQVNEGEHEPVRRHHGHRLWPFRLPFPIPF